jgi:hypothetical protein
MHQCGTWGESLSIQGIDKAVAMSYPHPSVGEVKWRLSDWTLALDDIPKKVQGCFVLQIGKLPGIHKNAVIPTDFVPDMRLFPVERFFHWSAATGALGASVYGSAVIADLFHAV